MRDEKMRDEKEERKKQARSNSKGKQHSTHKGLYMLHILWYRMMISVMYMYYHTSLDFQALSLQAYKL